MRPVSICPERVSIMFLVADTRVLTLPGAFYGSFELTGAFLGVGSGGVTMVFRRPMVVFHFPNDRLLLWPNKLVRLNWFSFSAQ